jgi:uncharacterized protein (TIGR02996 family)
VPDAYRLPDWELLLKAVVASPDDDLPRLVAADWLDEHGEGERAEFIRVQIERAKADRPELAWREAALWNIPILGPLWAVEACPNIAAIRFGTSVREVDMTGTDRVTFRRGFPFRVSCTAADWLRFGGGVIPRQPVREVSLTRCREMESADWWKMAATLRPLARLEVDTTSLSAVPFIRDHICPGVEVCTPEGLSEDEIVSGRTPPSRGRTPTPPPFPGPEDLPGRFDIPF